MSEAQTKNTEAIARRYFDAWTAGDTAIVTTLLADDFSFKAGDMSIEGKDTSLRASAFPKDAQTTMVAQAYQGQTAFRH